MHTVAREVWVMIREITETVKQSFLCLHLISGWFHAWLARFLFLLKELMRFLDVSRRVVWTAFFFFFWYTVATYSNSAHYEGFWESLAKYILNESQTITR